MIKWFLGLILTWSPILILMFLFVGLEELEIIPPSSKGGDNSILFLLLLIIGTVLTFIFNFGRKPGGFLDKWLDNLLKRK